LGLGRGCRVNLEKGKGRDFHFLELAWVGFEGGRSGRIGIVVGALAMQWWKKGKWARGLLRGSAKLRG
jgi:hypothetical protein